MGRLVVVPTPIGNLEDITLRALRELRNASLILAEDTRRTRTLLHHFEIAKPLLSYHEHNQRSREARILAALETGDVALVSDAGMPGISDPGAALIRAAVEAGVQVEVLPGPSAAVTAAVIAAFDAPGFVFAGFLPRRKRERRARLEELGRLLYPVVLYEAPHRLVMTLTVLVETLGDREVVVVRELTKIHEEVIRGSLTEVTRTFEEREPRGEIVLVVGPAVGGDDRREEAHEEVTRRRAMGQNRRTVVEEVSREYGISRNAAYRLWLETAMSGDEPGG